MSIPKAVILNFYLCGRSREDELMKVIKPDIVDEEDVSENFLRLFIRIYRYIYLSFEFCAGNITYVT